MDIIAGWYNFRVPTPFYHLSLAEELIHHYEMPGEISTFLQNFRSEFIFGSTAPDVQVVSGQPREVTHFFNLPIQANDPPAWVVFAATYPQLTEAGKLPEAQSAFLAGYLCHLQADWLWVNEIFVPAFGPRAAWSTFRQRLYYHNVLRAYLYRQILAELPVDEGNILGSVQPDGWLPFVEAKALAEWRDLLAQQLYPGAEIQTVEVFSSRQGISPPEYYDLLRSDERMQGEVFVHLPLWRVERYREQVLKQNLSLLMDTLAFRLHPTCYHPSVLQ